MSPLQQLVRWVIDVHGGRVHRDLYHAQGIALGCRARSERALRDAAPTDAP